MMVANHLPYFLGDDEESNLLQLEGAPQNQYHVLTAPTDQTASYILETAEPETDGLHGDRSWQVDIEALFDNDAVQAGSLSAEQLEITRQILLSGFE